MSLENALASQIKAVASEMLTQVVEVVRDNIAKFNDDDVEVDDLVQILSENLKLEVSDDKKSRTSVSKIGDKLKGLSVGKAGTTAKETKGKAKSGSKTDRVYYTREEFVELINKTSGGDELEADLCFYCSPRGENRHKFCGRPATYTSKNDTDNFLLLRCEKCKENKGVGETVWNQSDSGPTKRIAASKKNITGVTARSNTKKATGKSDAKPKASTKKKDDDEDDEEEDEDNEDELQLEASPNESLKKLLNDEAFMICSNEGIKNSLIWFDINENDGKIYGTFKTDITTSTKINKKMIESLTPIEKGNKTVSKLGLKTGTIKELIALMNREDEEEEVVAPKEAAKKGGKKTTTPPKKTKVQDDDDEEEEVAPTPKDKKKVDKKPAEVEEVVEEAPVKKNNNRPEKKKVTEEEEEEVAPSSKDKKKATEEEEEVAPPSKEKKTSKPEKKTKKVEPVEDEDEEPKTKKSTDDEESTSSRKKISKPEKKVKKVEEDEKKSSDDLEEDIE